MPRADAFAPSKYSPICIRPASAAQRARWEAAASEAGETTSELIRGAVDRELASRRKERELEEKRRAEIAANPLAALDEVLAQARKAAAG